MIRKDVLVAILATFCLMATLFLAIPIPTKSQSQSPTGTYDPWVDLNDDGQINILDAIILSNHFLTSGTPINKTALLDLQSQIDALNATLQSQIDALNATITELQNNNTELENRVSVLEGFLGLPIVNISGLIGYWRFDEGSRNIAHDSSGNNNDGILVNNPQWVDGKYGKALSFDGVDDYVQVPQSSSLDIANSVSVAAWVYPKAFPAFEAILSRWYDGTEPDRGIVLELKQGSYVRFGVIDDSNLFDIPFSFEINKWYFLAATWNGSVSRVYVNGMEIGNNSTLGSFTNQNVNLSIGCDTNPFQVQFNGTIDNVMIYNRALNDTEVLNLYLNPPP